MKRLTSLLLAALLTLGLFAGCSSTGAQPTMAPNPTSGAGSGDWVGPRKVTLTDQAGREVTIEGQVERIVSGYYISTSACIALGLQDKMVGIEKKIIPIYELAAPAFLELPTVGTAKEFDLEGCIALEPDLVILPKKLKDAAETMEKLGIPVLLVNPENQDQLVEMLTLIAKATETQDRAEAISATYYMTNEKLKELTKDLTDEQKPVVYMGGNGSILSTAPKDMYQATLIRNGGGVNAGDGLEGDTWTEVSYEQVLAMDPDVIILPSDASYTVDDVKNDAQLAALKAVKNGAVYAMPGVLEAWDSPVPSCVLGSEWLMAVLHEDLFSLEEMKVDAKVFYRNYYGIEINAEQITK